MFSKRYSIVIFLLLFSIFSVFADDGIPPDADDGGDPVAASIDENIYVLFFIGIVVAFFFFRYNKFLKLKSIEE
jgi:hypothetical protein